MLDVVKSCVIIPLIYLYTILMATLSLVLSLVDRGGRLQHWCARTWCRMIAVTAGARISVRGLENLPRDQACVVIANHQSYLDIPALWGCLPLQFRILAKRGLFYLPFLGWFLWRAGHIPVDRENARAALANVNRAVDKLKAGYSIVVFPEGTRSPDGTLREFKSGGFKIALKAGVPVLPVTIIGTARVLKKNSLVFHPGAIEVIIDPPLATTAYNSRTLPELIAVTRARIEAHLTAASGKPRSAVSEHQTVSSR
jgi:1-acyl-sn-glycerol-3-phosphate acyltransferase